MKYLNWKPKVAITKFSCHSESCRTRGGQNGGTCANDLDHVRTSSPFVHTNTLEYAQRIRRAKTHRFENTAMHYPLVRTLENEYLLKQRYRLPPFTRS